MELAPEQQRFARAGRSSLARQDWRSAAYIGVYLTVVFSGTYLTRLGISPVYPLMGGGLLLLGLLLCAGKIRFELNGWACFVFLLGALAIFAIQQNNTGAMIQNVVNFLLGPLSFFLVAGAGRLLSKRQLERIARSFVYLTLALALVECAYRLTHPDYTFLQGAEERNVDVEEVAFYAYKFSSLMYLDSNFVGLQLAVMFAFCLALARQGIRFRPVVYALMLALIVLTLSRASMFASVTVIAAFVFVRLSRLLQAVALTAAVLAAQAAFFYIQADGSFLTKLDLLNQFSAYLDSASTATLLFGAGVGNAAAVLGMGAHNLLVTYGVELGVLMSVLVLLFWTSVGLATRDVFFLLLVWLVNGFSLTSFAIPYMYCAAAILFCLPRLGAGAGASNATSVPEGN
jgi:hypothetical protein